jgi:hypothetical protein
LNGIEIIDRLVAEWESATDEEVLAGIRVLPPLADEEDECWNTDNYYVSALFPFLAFAGVAAKRRLRPAVRLLLERASYGDPGETMRGMRHSFEAIFNPDWESLGDEYLALARSERLGTRLWAIDCLVVLDDSRAVPVFELSVDEDPEEIRHLAEMGLKRILHPEKIAAERAEREVKRRQERQERLNREVEADAQITKRRCSECRKPMPSYRKTCKHCGAPKI